ncbi:MAG: hypothetical protein NUV91_04810 [Candidatus Omnitrophica bacterium]|nr:hypothetical protein [Candidatus Omnitrophota bacterium]
MTGLVIGLVGLFIGGIVFLTSRSSSTQKGGEGRLRYMKSLAHFVEGKLVTLEDTDHTYQIEFFYKKQPFFFVDMEDKTLRTSFHNAFLKLKTPYDFTLMFSEKPRTKLLRSEASQSMSDLSHPWTQEAPAVRPPKALEDFAIYTNHPNLANRLLADERALKIFSEFKNRDNRGRAVMSLSINEGMVTLRFHPPGTLNPNLFDVQSNVSRIDRYLEDLAMLGQILKELQEDKS